MTGLGPCADSNASVRESTASRSALPGLKCGTRFSGMATLSPERGLRPMRGGRRLTEKLPKPRISIRWPRTIASLTASRRVLTAYSASRCVNWPNWLANSSTRSLRVMKSGISQFWGQSGQEAALRCPVCPAKLFIFRVHFGAKQCAQIGQARAFFGRLLTQTGHGFLLVSVVFGLD